MTVAAHLDVLKSGGRSPNPLVIEVTRGDMVESRHRASLIVADASGAIVLSAGDVEQPIYGRSAIKPLQAVPLLESGAAAHYRLSEAEIALACASHNGEPDHVAAVTAWLERIGLSIADLECGAQLPYHEPSLLALIGAGSRPTAAHNNCSGKHAGFLSTARHLGEPTKGYIRLDHPVQARILALMEELGGRRLGDTARGIDGCGIPTIGMPLDATALAMARLADPAKLQPARAAAARCIVKAMTSEPFMVAGTGRFCTEVMTVIGAKAAIKTGAEGVFTGILPGRGLGIALKVDDGAGRAAEVTMGALLRHLGIIDEEAASRLEPVLTPRVANRVGLTVGQVRPAADAPF